jgi:hypothetical protein
MLSAGSRMLELGWIQAAAERVRCVHEGGGDLE